MRKVALEFHTRPGYKASQSQAQRGKVHKFDPEQYAAQNAKHSQWVLGQYAEGTEWAQKVRAGASPNKLEQLMLTHLGPLGWEFVGDGQVWIVGKNPDFIHREEHRLLEVFGDYWHQEDNSQERITHFATYGWPCTVIWESEIKADLPRVLTKIQGALHGKGN